MNEYKWRIQFAGNDVFNTERTVIAPDFATAFEIAKVWLNELQKSQLEELEIVCIERYD